MPLSPEQLRDFHVSLILAPSPDPPPHLHQLLNRQWRKAEKILLQIAERCQYWNPQGFSVYVAATPVYEYHDLTPSQLEQIFGQGYGPPKIDLLASLERVLQDFFYRRAHPQNAYRGEIVVAILDQEPKHRQKLIRLLVDASLRLKEEHELGVLFAQIGEDILTKGFLHALDNDLHRAGARHDIVDARQLLDLKPDSIDQFLLNALLD
ncbi:MAG: hypothetical protein GC158_03480 [Cyanobacteria bacterium RI_101]|nr:hypothetical protein [Cyanobacteria bacterium RI_101]